MARAVRQRPERLADKLLLIRNALGLSQSEMARKLGLGDEIPRDYISAFERGVREPPLPVLLQYGRAAGVWVDVLIDDELDLPKQLPGGYQEAGRGKPSSRKR